MASLTRHALALALAAAITLTVISGFNQYLREHIADNQRRYQQMLLRESLRDVEYDNIIIQEQTVIPLKSARMDRRWHIQHQGQTVAVAARAITSGYGGDIVFIAAFNLRGERLGARIVKHSETPGIADFLLESDGASRAIDGVSSATITSNAVATATQEIRQWLLYNNSL